MSDIMTCIPFEQLVTWMLEEKKTKDTVFGVHQAYIADTSKTQKIFNRKLETPIGPAAGPHSQLAQNIVASYYAGSRFFELKTVQIMDGAELAACVNKPCILADDEGYNCEWSTELYVPEAMDEYIKAWFMLHIMAKEYGLGNQDGFQFNISVGYDLAGIKSDKINTFIEGMKDASTTESFQKCKNQAIAMIDKFEHIKIEDIEAIPAQICNSVTISTLHGCPPQEIESIASYLLKEKQMHTFVKCNPTLLGYDFARKTMDDMGYDYVVFGDFHFNDDLQYEDAIPMLKRLMEVADTLKLSFGVKITNTFPVDVKAGELPSEEMYMSGKSLFALSISLAAKLSKEFDGKLRIAYSGGADYYNIERIVAAGIWPVTVATTLLKPGGYQRFTQMAKCLEDTAFKTFAGIDLDAVEQLAKDAKTDKHHRKCAKELPSRKMKQEVPLLDCFIAPCEEGCPIHQDVTNYIALAGEGKYKEALQVILDKNPLPFITGTICAHNCMTKCTRNFYDEPVNIRGTKLIAAQGGYDSVIKDIQPTTDKRNRKVAVVGGGPTGIAAAYFLLRAGAEVTIFEKTNALGGVVRHTIPSFRITGDAIDKDISLIEKMGADIRTNVEIGSIEELKTKGYEDIVVAVGASTPGTLQLETGDTLNALDFLAEFKAKDGNLNLGKNVVVVGGGNTAMDTARAAKRTKGVEHVYLVYRRTKRYMPADEEELVMALEDGVIFKDLLSPLSLENGKLRCRKMELSEERDASGRCGIIETQVIETVDADTVIVAVGEKVPTQYYKSNTFAVDEKGKVIVNCETCETSLTGVYVVGDGLGGPATVVEGIRDAMKAASAIVAGLVITDIKPEGTVDECYAKKGILISEETADNESERCLKCNTICENCVEVCPNRANISIKVTGMDMPQIIHVDYMCNECGNCKSFCPYASAPYKDKFTLFASEEHMNDSKNDGFVVLNQETMECKVRLLGKETICKCKDAESEIHKGLRNLMQSVIEDYRYLIMK